MLKKKWLFILLSYLCLSALTAFAGQVPAGAVPSWQIIPPTPDLPKPEQSGYVPIHQLNIWYATYGKGEPVILLHGGLANSDYWGRLIPALQQHYRVIVMDNRGHGRSTLGDEPISYHLMAEDVLGLMDYLKIKKAAIVGWSDGANIGLDLAIHHPEKLTKLFALAGNTNPEATLDVSKSPAFDEFVARIKKEYLNLSLTPSVKSYNTLRQRVEKMWASEPNLTKQMLERITTPTWIVIGDHDEAVKRSDAEYMAKTIPNAGLLIEPNAGHFVFLQHPEMFNDDVLNFLR